MKQKKTYFVGAHMSIARGFSQSVYDAESIGCTAFQIFTKSNRQWKSKPITDAIANDFKQTVGESSIKKEHIFAHASYLINLGSGNELTVKQSTTALFDELKRCEQLGIHYLVLHPGSHGGKLDNETCLQQISKNIDEAFDSFEGKTMLLLENMAGQGNSVGHQLEQLATIHALSKHKKKIGYCFDTCHGFAAGYEFQTEFEYKAFWEKFDQILGVNKLKLIHLNDSKQPKGSRVDRHAEINEGKIGSFFFRKIMKDDHLKLIAKIIETPKDSLADDERNIQKLLNYLNQYE